MSKTASANPHVRLNAAVARRTLLIISGIDGSLPGGAGEVR